MCVARRWIWRRVAKENSARARTSKAACRNIFTPSIISLKAGGRGRLHRCWPGTSQVLQSVAQHTVHQVCGHDRVRHFVDGVIEVFNPHTIELGVFEARSRVRGWEKGTLNLSAIRKTSASRMNGDTSHTQASVDSATSRSATNTSVVPRPPPTRWHAPSSTRLRTSSR
jgi:hypothetical protein